MKPEVLVPVLVAVLALAAAVAGVVGALGASRNTADVEALRLLVTESEGRRKDDRAEHDAERARWQESRARWEAKVEELDGRLDREERRCDGLEALLRENGIPVP